MLRPQEGPQLNAILAAWCDELFFGGAKYGGKSYFMLLDFLQDVPEYGEHWHGILVRQNMPELEDMIRVSHEIFPQAGAKWGEQKKTWTFKEGSTLKMRALEKAEDFKKYNGHSYGWIGFDELPQWPDMDGYNLMKGCLRWAGAEIPNKRMRATGNPYGPGVPEVKAYFIDRAPFGYVPYDDPESKMTRMFIPSLPEHNKLGLLNDPGYIDRLKGIGKPELVEALLKGRWDVVLGAYFTNFNHERHVLPTFQIPPHWMRFRSMDWGYGAPFSVGWWAVANGEQIPGLNYYIPKGALIRYNEWYGAAGKNDGLKMANKQIARGIIDRTGSDVIAYTVADSICFANRGGTTISDDFAEEGVLLQRADDRRVPGWQQLVQRFTGMRVGEGDTVPMMFFQQHCINAIKFIPMMQHCKRDPNDVDTDLEDHCPDEIRYGAMSRPWVQDEVKPQRGKTLKDVSLNELWELNKRDDNPMGRV